MSKHLEHDLNVLRRDLLALAASVESAIHKAIAALESRKRDLAQQVVDGDHEIDENENRIEIECLNMLALRQPVAADFRLIAATLKINGELERMGDLAEDIAGRVIRLSSLPPIPLPETLRGMADLTASMVHQSVDAFGKLDARLARTVCQMDDEVDRLNTEIIEHVIQIMQSSPEAVEVGLSLFSAVRHLERIADHATNIAEDVVYLVEGGIIRHRTGTAIQT